MCSQPIDLTPSELKSAIVRELLRAERETLVIEVIDQMSGVRTRCDTQPRAEGQLDELEIESRSSCVLVVKDHQLLGILTDRDVVRLCAQQRSLENLTIGEVMIHPVITLNESDFTDLFLAINLLKQHHIRHLPILDDQDRLVGLVTYESLRHICRPIDLLRWRRVSEVMTREVIVATADCTILTIAQQMAEHRVSSVMIVQSEGHPTAPLTRPVGMITERDIVQFQALGLNLEACSAQTVMSTPIFAVTPDDSLLTVQEMMEQRPIRRLAVIGEQGELLGIVTQTSLLQAFNPWDLYKLAERLEQKARQLEAEKIQLWESRARELEQQMEARTLALKTKVEQEKLVTTVAWQIRSSLSLQTILETTVGQVRQLLGCDRVMICQFQPDGQMFVIAESTELPQSLLGELIEDTCWLPHQLESYRQGQIRMVSDIHTTEMSDCHRDLLINLQTRAKILVPLFCGDTLWGLLNVTESQHPREWQPEEVKLLQGLSVHLAIAIQQATIHQSLQQKLIEQQQAELRLRDSEQRYLNLSAAAPVGIFHTDAQGNSLYINSRGCEMLGLSPEATRGNGWQQALHPDDRDQVMAETRRSRQENRPFELEYRIVRPDGTVLWVLGRAVAQYDLQGEVTGYLGTLTDVTQLHTALEELQQAQCQLNQLNQTLEAKVEERTAELQERETQFQKISERLAVSLKSAAIGCWEWDLQENIIFWDERMYELYGVTQSSHSQVIYDIWANALHPDDRTATETLLQQTVLGQAEYDTEFRVVRADGSIHVIKAYGVVVPDAQGNPQCMIGVNFEITDRKQAEEAQIQYIREIEDLYNNAPCGYHSLDPQGRYLRVNDTELKWLGYSREEMIGKPLIDFFTEASRQAFRKNYQLFIAQGWVKNLEYEMVCKDGTLLPVMISAIAVKDANNNYLYNRATLIEIRDRQQAEQIIRQQAQREKLLREISQRIRHSLDLQTIFDTACQEIRLMMQADRVGIFKFYPESHFDEGEFVAESVIAEFSSVLAIRVQDHCFGDHYSSLYAQGRAYIVDDIYNAGMTPCHTDVLAQFQIKACLVMPLLCGEMLWGLLCVHQCATTRYWQESDIDVTQQLANQLAIAIQQVDLYQRIQSELRVRQRTEAKIALQLRQQQALGTIIQHIRESLDLDQILTTVTQQVKAVLHSDRVLVFRLFPNGRSQILEEAVSAEFPLLKNCHWEDEVWSDEILEYYWQGHPRIVLDVMNDRSTECLREYSIQGQIQSKIVAPILQDVRDRENHRWVAPCQTNKLWGVLVVHACGEKRIWQDSDAEILQHIANQLAIAIQQAHLFQQLQQELAERQQAQQQLTQSNQQLAISNEELVRATRLKDEFLANMSHELRTPLNAILGMTEGLQEGIFGLINEQQRKALQTIDRSGSHLLELINDVLDVAKIESGQIELDCLPISVASLCQSSLVFIKQQALRKRIQLELKLPLNLPDLLVDERRIRQVLINLLNNAVKFTPEGGRITLEVTRLCPASDPGFCEISEYLQIAIIDTGIGIAPENIQKLFEPFVQIDSALNRQYSGTGLGLALVKRIVEVHGGRVGLTSELGVGSCFTIDLPCVQSQFLPPNLNPNPEPVATSNPEFLVSQDATDRVPLILLAEDNAANISTVSSYLRAKGYRILLAKNGQEAIDLAQAHQPDLILMDIQMPGMDGLEATRQIRLNPQLVDVPIIALTALAMTGDRERCLAAGATDYITKPIKLKQLASTIQQLLVLTQ